MSRIDQPRMIRALRRYFASGWAFLIPYLAVYLLYYATDWPVNPASDSEPGEIPASAMPCLLYVYWALHALHVALALLASASAKVEEGMVNGEKNAPGGDDQGRALHHQPLRAMSSELLATIIRRFRSLFTLHPSPFSLHSALFWLLLALIFYIPGVYLEWPSDPWEHLRRINEWHATATVGAHSCWYKSAYFIPYSLLSWATGLRQLFWLDFYYTGICLLLCWQYYRLARACGLGERASMIFVLIQAILFGNNIFSFYRYYGISSSIYAQIGAVAITRIALEFATRGTSQEQHSGWPASENIRARVFWHWPTLLKATLPAIACLVPFVAFNHQQGIGIAALGVLAIVIWRTIEWRRRALWWIIAGTLIFNALFLWLYPRLEIVETYQNSGWLNAWYGFNIFDFSHPAGDRMLQIVSAFGLVNIVAALLLLRRNHVSAWLTLPPLIALSLPCISIPFATALSSQGVANIITFQRMLLAVPFALALVYWATSFRLGKCKHVVAVVHATLAILMVVSPSRSLYNRVWHTLTTPPNDITLRTIQPGHESLAADTKALTTIAGQSLASLSNTQIVLPRNRAIGAPAAKPLEEVEIFLRNYQEGITMRGASECHKQDAATNLGVGGCPPHFTSTPERWSAFSDARPLFTTAHMDKGASIPVFQNPRGAACSVFTKELVPISNKRIYCVTIDAQQTKKTKNGTYLAIAWYDIDKNLLESYANPPKGAGSPRGWTNGTFSYFGLIDQPPATTWRRYSTCFGLGENFEIPPHAAFVRIGALLNYTATPRAEIQIANSSLIEITPPRIRNALPRAAALFTWTSQAAQLSIHWPAQQALYENAGIKEIADLLVPIDSTSSDRGKPANRE